MKTHDTTSDNDYTSRAAANELQRKTGPENDGLISAGPNAQRRHTDMINGSPYMVSQRKRLHGLSGRALQKQEDLEEEELLQGKSAAQRQPEEEEELQGKFAAQRQPMEDEELMQGKFTAQLQAPEEEEELMQGKFKDRRSAGLGAGQNRPLQQKPKQPDENRTGIPDELKASMESTLNTDFSQVRIHPNSSKATEVGALAYTQGADIHFAPGQFKPESADGQQLLGHELTHVVQQSQGKVQPNKEVAGIPVNDSPELEKEADKMGAKINK